LREVISFVKAASIEKIAFRLANLEVRFAELETRNENGDRNSLNSVNELLHAEKQHRMKEKIRLLELENDHLKHHKHQK